MSGILVIFEEREGAISHVSWEALVAGQRLGRLQNLPVSVVTLGLQDVQPSTQMTCYPLDKLLHVEHFLLATYTSDGYSGALEQLIREEMPDYVIFPHTYQVRDYAPALSARFEQVLIGDVIEIEMGPIFTRQLMQGRLNGHYRQSGNGPCFFSVQAGAFPVDKLDTPKEAAEANITRIESFTPTLAPSQIRTQPGTPFRGSAQTVDLTSAQRIVSIGRGIQEEANIALVQELATALNAELAASRPVCDNGWLPHDRQVGSSGQTVAPKLYLAIGISGAIQHQVGMKGAQCVVAINKDPDAPIFEIADYGIVGDLFEVVPALIEAVKASADRF